MAYRTILLIDDDEDDQEFFLEAIAEVSQEVTCTTFYNASDALNKLKNGALKPDVIFLDLNMPIMNGLQFLAEIKQQPELQHIPVLIFSTSSHTATIEQTKEMGALDFITKPGTFSDLVNILTHLLR